MATMDKHSGLAGQPGRMAPLCRFSDEVLASENVVPVVLEFEQPPVALYKRLNPQADADQYQERLAQSHRAFLEHLASLGLGVQLGTSSMVVAGPNGNATVNMPHDFTVIFNGLGVLMPGRVVAQVASMGGVRAVTLNQERVYLNGNQSIAFTGAPKLWNMVDAAGKAIKGEGVTVAVIDTGKVWQFGTRPSE